MPSAYAQLLLSYYSLSFDYNGRDDTVQSIEQLSGPPVTPDNSFTLCPQFLGIQGKSPGIQGKSPGIQSKSPGIQGKSPGIQSKSPGIRSESLPKVPFIEEYVTAKAKKSNKYFKRRSLFFLSFFGFFAAAVTILVVK
jgi:hypothetical protein